MSSPKKKSCTKNAVTAKLEMCERAIEAWENYRPCYGVNPRKVCDAIAWLMRWQPSMREYVGELADRMSTLLEGDNFDYYDFQPWDF